MNDAPVVYTIDIPAHTRHTETIELASGDKEQVLNVRAGAAAQVSIFCRGIKLAGSLTLDIAIEHPDVHIIVGIAGTVEGDDLFMIKSMQKHYAPRSASHLYIRKIVSDNAKAVYHGMIHIAQDAFGSDVSQNDKTLFDGNSAQAESVPAIEVLTDDVRCKHGSAMGRIDSEALWYLRTRGLSYDQAKRLWYSAFLDEAYTAPVQKS